MYIAIYIYYMYNTFVHIYIYKIHIELLNYLIKKILKYTFFT